jgi:hypothetical protein
VSAYGCQNLLTKVSDGCYVDLESSACRQPGAVQCTELDAGVDEACCPQYTTCTPGYNASTTLLRCDIPEMALNALSPSVKSSLEDAMQTNDASSIGGVGGIIGKRRLVNHQLNVFHGSGAVANFLSGLFDKYEPVIKPVVKEHAGRWNYGWSRFRRGCIDFTHCPGNLASLAKDASRKISKVCCRSL